MTYSFKFPDDGRSISRNVASLNLLIHDTINLLYYEQRTEKKEKNYVQEKIKFNFGIRIISDSSVRIFLSNLI